MDQELVAVVGEAGRVVEWQVGVEDGGFVGGDALVEHLAGDVSDTRDDL